MAFDNNKEVGYGNTFKLNLNSKTLKEDLGKKLLKFQNEVYEILKEVISKKI
jgi:stress-induced morphogen